MLPMETERLILKPWSEEDAEALYAYAKDPDVGPHAGWKPHADAAESLHIIRTLFLPNDVWAVVLKSSGKIIGSVGLEPDKRRPGIKSSELGYALSREHWGKGVMTEAAKAVIDFAFEVFKLDVIAICTGPKNKRSQSVIQKCGFTYEGTERRCYVTYDGTIRDTKCYSLLREEWESEKAKTD
ncbi:MAG: GNAT family N-acetyltransferase [Synergistaceae bacterium]|nr:GNAT family N-acetyltransferase [Synergistaceae bacterium]